MEFLLNTLARDVMTKHVICVYPKTSIKELSSIFIENLITGAPVLDSEENVIGFVSQTDIVELDLHSEDYLDSRLEETGGYVQDIMVPEISCVHETDPLAKVIDKMCTEKNHRLVVLNDQEKVAGILTTMDVMCYLQKKIIALQ
ncbi:putative signal transduction protein with CBS domains [Candidatus Vecturithrix granuli]|uniref:Putative signal transduction protein with CBS domains n=1 Tax=Vecturithrix granuli TaxID=1499967 RepID=A0A081BX48_VECG1|nr:putative signal transduction protein with CBS domains [Candidatus Vecturithrix granuli]